MQMRKVWTVLPKPQVKLSRKRQPASGEVQSLLRGLALIEAFCDLDGAAASLSELARRTGLSPSTTHRLLATLQAEGYVTREADTNHYVLGHRIAGAAATLQQRTSHLRSLARPHLEDIAQTTGETTNLVMLDGRWSVYVDKVEGTHALRMTMRIGTVFPAHTSASAKAILAYQPDDSHIAEIFAGALPRKLCKNTIVTAQAFKAGLKIIRAKGYAIENEELEQGVSCIAAPILGPDGTALAAISVPGPTPRIMAPNPDRIGLLVRRHAGEVSAALGFTPSDQPPAVAGHARPSSAGR